MTSAKDLQHGVGQTGLFGEIFIGLGLLIGLVGAAFWILDGIGFYAGSPAGDVAAHGDWVILSFLLVVEGVGFTVFGVMCLVAGWDRHHHPDLVH